MKSQILGFALLASVAAVSVGCTQVSGHLRDEPVNVVSNDGTCELRVTRDAAGLPADREEVGVLYAEGTEFAAPEHLEQQLREVACANGVTLLLVVDEGYRDLVRGSWATAVAFSTK